MLSALLMHLLQSVSFFAGGLQSSVSVSFDPQPHPSEHPNEAHSNETPDEEDASASASTKVDQADKSEEMDDCDKPIKSEPIIPNVASQISLSTCHDPKQDLELLLCNNYEDSLRIATQLLRMFFSRYEIYFRVKVILFLI